MSTGRSEKTNKGCQTLLLQLSICKMRFIQVLIKFFSVKYLKYLPFFYFFLSTYFNSYKSACDKSRNMKVTMRFLQCLLHLDIWLSCDRMCTSVKYRQVPVVVSTWKNMCSPTVFIRWVLLKCFVKIMNIFLL